MNSTVLGGFAVFAAVLGLLAVVIVMRRERRTAIDLDAAFGSAAPRCGTAGRVLDLNATGVDELGDDGSGGPTWSASIERGLVAVGAAIAPIDVMWPAEPAGQVASPAPEVRSTARRSPSALPAVARPRFVPVTVAAEYDGFDPRLPLPGEPERFVARAGELGGVRLGDVLAERIGEVTRELVPDDCEPESPPDAYEVLRRQRDHIARQVELAYREVHGARRDTLRRATQAEAQAEQALAARERNGRLGRDRRRRDRGGGRAPAPADREGLRKVHELRVDSLKRAAEAETGAERVAMLRDKAARLLAEQRRLEREMARQLESLLD